MGVEAIMIAMPPLRDPERFKEDGYGVKKADSLGPSGKI